MLARALALVYRDGDEGLSKDLHSSPDPLWVAGQTSFIGLLWSRGQNSECKSLDRLSLDITKLVCIEAASIDLLALYTLTIWTGSILALIGVLIAEPVAIYVAALVVEGLRLAGIAMPIIGVDMAAFAAPLYEDALPAAHGAAHIPCCAWLEVHIAPGTELDHIALLAALFAVAVGIVLGTAGQAELEWIALHIAVLAAVVVVALLAALVAFAIKCAVVATLIAALYDIGIPATPVTFSICICGAEIVHITLGTGLIAGAPLLTFIAVAVGVVLLTAACALLIGITTLKALITVIAPMIAQAGRHRSKNSSN
jgi:hypothetical protein